MKTVLRLVVFLAAVRVLAQGPPAGAGAPEVVSPMVATGSLNTPNIVEASYRIEGVVKTLRGDPVRDAKVAVKPWNFPRNLRSLRTDERGKFRTEITLSVDMTQNFAAEVKASKRGYLPAHEIVDFGTSGKTWIIPITLRRSTEDPELLSQEDLITGLAPRLKQLTTSDGLSDKEAKVYARGVKEFLDRDNPEGALSYLIKVDRLDDFCPACRTMLGLAELASNDWDGAERHFSQAYKAVNDNRSKARPEPDIAYGVMKSWQHEPAQAATLFLDALKTAPHDALALKELGRSQLAVENWGGADDYLRKAIGAGADSEARLLRAKALLREGKLRESNRELTAYLAGRDAKKMAPQVRQLWEEVQTRQKEAASSTGAVLYFDRPVELLLRTNPELKGLEPTLDQRQLDAILNEVGKKVAASYQDFPNTVSREQIRQEQLQRSGRIGQTFAQEFRYLCLVSPGSSGPGFREYRTDLSGGRATPRGLQDGFMLTSGFTSAALHFHPLYRADSQFRYLGRQKADGQETFVIAFAQRPGKARLSGTFLVRGEPSTTFSQGVAWIDAKSYEIIRVHLDLLSPLPAVQLERQTTEVDFGAVHFKKYPQEEFWLPQRVVVAVDWNGKRLRNEHQYSDFQLFNVNASESENQRRTPAPPSKGESGPGTP